MVPLALNLNPSARSCSPTYTDQARHPSINHNSSPHTHPTCSTKCASADLVEAGEGGVLAEEAALGEARDEVREALVVGERGPDGLQRRADAHPRAHDAPVLLPRQLTDLHLEPVSLVPVHLLLSFGAVCFVVGGFGRRRGRGGDPVGVPGRGGAGDEA
jgi:hypothetical protein